MRTGRRPTASRCVRTGARGGRSALKTLTTAEAVSAWADSVGPDAESPRVLALAIAAWVDPLILSATADWRGSMAALPVWSIADVIAPRDEGVPLPTDEHRPVQNSEAEHGPELAVEGVAGR